MAQYPDLQLYIGGSWRKTASGLPVINPADEAVIGQVPVASRVDLDDALAAAAEGLKVWSRTAPARRAEIMLKAAALMRERIEEIAFAITLEHGKPIAQARLEVIRGCEFFEWDAAEGLRTYGRVIPSEPGIKYLVLHRPIGVVAAFSPWNFPMSQPARKIGGALAAGCSIIIKAAEETPAGALHIVRAFHDAGLPPGVLNLVFGVPAEISEYLIPKDPVRLVAFTGSTAVGKRLTEMAGRHVKPVLMELGGHAPVIVCDDVDPVETAVMSAVRKMRNAGQVCTSPTRFFVQEPLYERFTRAFAEKARTITVGNGLTAGTEMGPLANHRRIEAMETLVADARAKGARLLAGGERLGNRGYFFAPTVLADVPDEARAMSEEPFGPLALINPVKTLDDALAKANALPFGLAAYAFTHSARNADHLAEGIEAGNFSINTLEASVAQTPFGGVKESGFGREGGAEGLSHYTVVKNVSHRLA
ncbi:NAD-dependent succinate-semialdehyde dehydrogenase [Bradyrhizobium sp. U87765 SZCCT0131]|uniref:NAD-dependent succinate-semialdehyde dehydrogenase n=1 Tax=unclassified Bradyrhizobium TaxID=2631580 RepID=UPI001BA83FE0|nr:MULTISPECIES: NAD-dependent succinate-semialdehyde dehydrogenase [unclassified Bradyrhizobium]MBR1220419.1 NAD-dependent succinate-semialdehyde dehydrogenase [Bradyrhizobium sp. U87765 SZCCT0131]MBR1263126.1 NAD-dependent succinate-semialdehyde dehydrogenase [Bradyrhizobium sp. U87765 SZCCT0134]MBR1306991.1 NAD-dependent succinate-semialdehyde dehydrogenase [Bradyrhizobium sp. U87765 SZCCT0110]MBR1323121.1 NAD-dependent succinate-semialdehyde dehydrogenase [Bradyrhizobium sp. U87765 SZCCT010